MDKAVATKKTVKKDKKTVATKTKKAKNTTTAKKVATTKKAPAKVTKTVAKKAKVVSAKTTKKAVVKPVKKTTKELKSKSKVTSVKDKKVNLKDRFDKKIEKLAKVEKETAVDKATVAQKPNNESTLSYTQIEFYDNVRAFCGFEKRNQAKEICDDITSFILDALEKGYKVPFLGLGKLYVRKTKARVVRDFTTGDTIHIKAKNRVRFAPAKSLLDF